MKAQFDDGNFRRGVNRSKLAMQQATRLAITDLALEIAAKADDLVPFDTGALSASQKIERPRMKLEATVSYGGPAAPYALVQHEDTELRHSPGRQAKYLEQPAREIGRDFDKRIERLVKRAL